MHQANACPTLWLSRSMKCSNVPRAFSRHRTVVRARAGRRRAPPRLDGLALAGSDRQRAEIVLVGQAVVGAVEKL